MSKNQPIFNGPNVVLFMLGLLIAVHIGRSFTSEDLDTWVLVAGAFIPSRYAGDIVPGGEEAKYTSFITHMFLHGDITHLGINCGWMLAFGTMVARRLTAISFIGLFLITGVGGALLFLAFNWGLAQPMIGASGAISGLMGAAVRFIFQPAGFEQASGANTTVKSMTLAELAGDGRARLMIGSWIAINLLFGLVLGQLFTDGSIAWEAHLGGFLAGLLLLPLFEGRLDRSL